MNRLLIAWMMILGLANGLSMGQIRSNVLDASPQIGSGGYNRPVPVFQGGYTNGGYGNLYMTGNVTGGKQFRGYMPYSDPTAFQGKNLGSSALSTFEGDATNVQRVESGITAGVTMPYYNRSSTILPLSAIRENYNQPGSSLPRTQVLPASPSYLSGATLEQSYSQAMQSRLPAAIRSEDVMVPSVAMPGASPIDVYTRPIDMVSPSETAESALTPRKRFEELQAKEEAAPIEPLVPPVMMEEPTLAPKGRDLSSWLKEQAEITEQAEQSRLIVGPDQEFAESAKQLAVQGKKAQSAPGTTQPSLEAVKPSNRSRSVVVTTLAGNGSDAFDLTMQSAQQLMNRGKFYDAYQTYIRAATIKVNNPLAVYGQANALISAGEFRSAGQRLQVAMKMFPKFVHLTLDGSRLLGGKSILDRRLGQVRNLSIKNDDQDLLLLAGYMEILAGNHDAGLGLIKHTKE
jgi:hypothetical protein